MLQGPVCPITILLVPQCLVPSARRNQRVFRRHVISINDESSVLDEVGVQQELHYSTTNATPDVLSWSGQQDRGIHRAPSFGVGNISVPAWDSIHLAAEIGLDNRWNSDMLGFDFTK